MFGIPQNLSTKQDWLNALAFVETTGNGKTEMKKRFLSLKQNSTMLVPKNEKKGRGNKEGTEAAELAPEDFHAVDDPGSEKNRLGFSDAELDEIIGRL